MHENANNLLKWFFIYELLKFHRNFLKTWGESVFKKYREDHFNIPSGHTSAVRRAAKLGTRETSSTRGPRARAAATCRAGAVRTPAPPCCSCEDDHQGRGQDHAALACQNLANFANHGNEN